MYREKSNERRVLAGFSSLAFWILEAQYSFALAKVLGANAFLLLPRLM